MTVMSGRFVVPAVLRSDRSGTGSLRLKIARWNHRPLGWVVALLAAALCSFSVMAQSASQAMGTIQGVVRDAGGAPISGASVHLRTGATGGIDTSSGADGVFSFSVVAGRMYRLNAEKDSLRSEDVSVSAQSGGLPQIVLVLVPIPQMSAGTEKARSATGAMMEFSDVPNVTIAAVTDWTAAGGHGSDVILRASEALNRETVGLKGGASGENADLISGAPELEANLRAGMKAAPQSFEANFKLGEFYLRAARFREAVPLFEAALRADPVSEICEYELAEAFDGSGDFTQARQHVRKLLARNTTPGALRLDGELDEKLGEPLQAVKAFEQAVHEDPSEENYFQWGSELLLHRAIWQAKDVFSAGAMRYPKSARMVTALGAALFAGALYDEAAQRLCEAAELSSSDPEPYLFLGRIEIASPNPLPCVEPKLAQFVQQQPGNALGNYYYAMAIWKQHGRSTYPEVMGRVEGLLTKTVSIDPKCAEAYLQLGNLSTSRHEDAKAIGFYVNAIGADPQLSEAHYRLAMVYDRVGEREKAKREFELHEEIDKEQKAAVERQRREVKQFLVVQGKPVEPAQP